MPRMSNKKLEGTALNLVSGISQEIDEDDVNDDFHNHEFLTYTIST